MLKINPTSRWVDFKTTHQLNGCTQNLHRGIHGSPSIFPWNFTMECRWISMFEETLNGLLMDIKKTLNDT
jgi:hypothetical protein